MNKEYIEKHEAYLLLKHKAETYMLPATKEAYEKAAILIDSIKAHDVEPVRHGRWIECDYKKLEHGFLETYPKAGLCCSVCRAGFEKKKMTYKQHCPCCGAKMDKEE